MTPAIAELLPARKSLAGWAVLAMVMVCGSYLLTLTLAVACVYVPYLILTGTGEWVWQVLAAFIGGIVIAATLMWSLIPRRERFKPPGPLLTASSQPRLFAEIERIAATLGEAMPEAVYLSADGNAGVARADSILGFGGWRVMVLGLPLVQALSVSEFRAVLAHEFGHYYGGDTRLGPWVYAARVTMARTLTRLAGNRQVSATVGRIPAIGLIYALVVLVLSTYWKLFMRATQLISRRQEYRADELACVLAGSEALMSGLRRIDGLAAALPLFWTGSMLPVLQAGARMPIAQSFSQFTALPTVASAISAHLATTLSTGKTKAFDSHPPLRDRLAAAQSFARPSPAEARESALTLFDSLDGIELQLLETMLPQLKARKLRLVAWDRVGRDVFLPLWRAFVKEHAGALAEIQAQDVARLAKDPRDLVARMSDPKGRLLARPQRAERARTLLWTALTVTLVDQGWSLRGGPGESCLERGGEVLNIPQLGRDVVSGKVTPEAWALQTRALGIAELLLAGPGVG